MAEKMGSQSRDGKWPAAQRRGRLPMAAAVRIAQAFVLGSQELPALLCYCLHFKRHAASCCMRFIFGASRMGRDKMVSGLHRDKIEWLAAGAIALLIALILTLAFAVSASVL